jgi:MoaA/NifB/PqqE/SkfB family radical SAM enzyme
MRGYLRLDIADNCNIRCIMCQAYNRLPIARVDFFDFDLFRRRTGGQLKEWSRIQLGNVAEAMIHPRFADFLRYIRSESDATIHIVTNGRLLDRYAALINEIGNCIVQVSMDSIKKEMHEYIREGSNFDRVMANLGLLDTSKTNVLLSFTLMNSNIGEYNEMAEFCKARGFNMGAFPMMLRDEDGIVPWRLVKESLWFNQKGLMNWLRHEYGNDYEKTVGSAATTGTTLTEFNCRAHETDLTIYNKRAILCGKRDLGSIVETDLEDMWQSEAATGFRASVDRDREPCMTCDYRQRCLAPSMSLLDNHFSERVATSIKPEVKAQIKFDRQCSDDEALDLFVRGTFGDLAIFDIVKDGDKFSARRVLDFEMRGEAIEAPTRDELHAKMVKVAQCTLMPPTLIDSYGGFNLVSYLGQIWGIPLSFGPFDLTNEQSRSTPGVIKHRSIEEVRVLIDSIDVAATAAAIMSDPALPR